MILRAKIPLAKAVCFPQVFRPVQTLLPFSGTYTAIVTPFKKDGTLDDAALERLVKSQIKGGVNGIVPVGPPGESPTLDYEEHIHVIKRSVEFAGGKIKVLAGTGGNSTAEAVYLTKMAKKAGADGSLQVAPYYNKPTQEGLVVVGRDLERSVRTGFLCHLRKIDSFGRRVATSAREHLDFAARKFDRALDDVDVFLVIERGGFARGADGHDAIYAALDLGFDQAFERGVVEEAVLFEGRYDGGVGSAEW